MEATEIDVASKFAGRVQDILVKEGDLVTAGQVVGHIERDAMEAQKREAEARVRESASNVATARSRLVNREADRTNYVSTLSQRETELANARRHSTRSTFLASRGAAPAEEADDDRTQVERAVAAVSAVQAQIAGADAAIAAARDEVTGAEADVVAARSAVEKIRSDLADNVLVAPRYGRVQYKVAQRGEVVGQGGRVLNMIDLRDVYMTFFLPTVQAGKVTIGNEARIVLDAMPHYVIPATISFVSDVAQFTPKTVETKTEREKLMFRVRARIPFELLQTSLPNIKTGLPGMAYVRVDSTAPWPSKLQVRLPK
jgi:HlyD family secretion protein